MKVEIPQIYWHGDRDRILSLDYFPNSNLLVTCGGENEEKHFIKFWEIQLNSEENQEEKFQQYLISNKDGNNIISLKYLYHIAGAHNSVVNILRFSPNGKFLASGGDDHIIVIWSLKKRPVEFGNSEEKAIWSLNKLLRGHSGDIYDLCWSDDSSHLVSGSVDNFSIIWNIEKGKGIIMLKEHQNFVQGVSWKNDMIVTESADKSINIYNVTKVPDRDLKVKLLKKVKHYIYESAKTKDYKKMVIDDQYEVQVEENVQIIKNAVSYFCSENQQPGFLRRLSWSLDGNFLLAVAGINKNYSENKYEFVVWGFAKSELTVPTFMLPTLSPAICIRFCPIIFKKDNKKQGLIHLTYKLVFAIGTQDAVLIYDTDEIHPKYVIGNIHLMPITDLAWNGCKLLSVSSSDGYISFINFSGNEFGEVELNDNLPDNLKLHNEQLGSINLEKFTSELESSQTNQQIIQVKARKKKD